MDMSAPLPTSKTLEKQHWSRTGFWSFIAVQAQGAFSDKFFATVIAYLLAWTAMSADSTHLDTKILNYNQFLSQFIMAIPFILFPGICGAFSDRRSKGRAIVLLKFAEVGIVLLATGLLYTHHAMGLWIVLFLLATQAAFFGPAKYGILPETLPEGRLSWANGILQMTTMVAIIAGVYVSSELFEHIRVTYTLESMYYLGFFLVACSLGGLAMSQWVTKPAAANPGVPLSLNPWNGMWGDLKVIATDRSLRMATIGYTYFWFVGALIMLFIPSFATGAIESGGLGLGEGDAGTLIGVLTLGIGIGSLVAGFASQGKIELGLVPIGALGLAVFSLLTAFFGTTFVTSAFFFFGLGFAAGFFDVPLATMVQQRSPEKSRGRVMATINMLTWLGVAAASPVGWTLDAMGLGSRSVIVVAGVLTLSATALLCFMLPVIMVRSILWILSVTFYRLRVSGRTHIPDKGGALFVANHTSFIDALAVLAATDRHVHFVMSQDIFDISWIKPIVKSMGVIPVSAAGGPAKLIQSLHAATDAIRNGEVVCIFAEGQITRTGQMLPFKKGFERIMRGVDAPIIPVFLDRFWGSIFSFAEGKFFFKLPRRIPYPIGISFGSPLPATSRSADVRTAVQNLGAEAYLARKGAYPLLHRAFISAVRRHPSRQAMADMTVKKLSYFKSYVGAIAMARALRSRIGTEKMVGLLVPPSVGGALANISLALMDRVAVNLNYTASKESLDSAGKQCNLKHVLTSKAFLEKFPVHVPAEPVYLEDVKKAVSSWLRITSLLMAVFLPVRVIERMLGAPRGRSCEDLAAIIFSSGSAGDPKGVMLSHKNVISNVEAVLQVFPHDKNDGMVGILPFFHSFGYMGTLWLPLVEGFRVAYHPTPLDAKAVGALIKKYKLTFLIATPTFLQTYIRRCLPEEMVSLKYVVTGAEKLPARIREAFKAKFTVEPLEGYGTTECAPAVSVNIPDFEAPGFFQVGTKHGTIGHPIPGVSVKIMHPETGEELHDGQPGLLFVKGPNIMQGYLKLPEKTAEVLQDGWYNTGDIAAIDEEGFVTITDRLARFSKIAGEMVPHNKVEEVLHDLMALTDQAMAVVGVPDEKKGEKLIVLHTLTDDQLEVLLSKLDGCGLPNLWMPKTNAFYRIDAIPVLGTGKMDLQKVKQLAKKVDLGE
jgi:acyl-[acyl-carrier-protein]-phospholipid O-acyltransferase/long-chain-fatty-acid--[acyl-carrier-protein] ligase